MFEQAMLEALDRQLYLPIISSGNITSSNLAFLLRTLRYECGAKRWLDNALSR